MSEFRLPSKLTFILSAAAGVTVAFVRAKVIELEPEWASWIAVGLTFLAAWGISPLTGPSFRSILHLSNGVSAGITFVLTALTIVVTQAHMSLTLHGVLAGLIAFAAGLGFAPSIALVARGGKPKWL